MIINGKGGKNTKTGLTFEGKTDLATFIGKQPGYRIEEHSIYYQDELVARVFKQKNFYTFFGGIGD